MIDGSVSHELLERGILRQMDIQNAMYPDDIPSVDAMGSLDPLILAKYIANNFPLLIKSKVKKSIRWMV